MEKKRMQRIMGILVLVAFVIVIMPLLLGKNDPSSSPEANNTQAPPFSDQAVASSTPSQAPAKIASNAEMIPPPSAAAIVENTPSPTTSVVAMPDADNPLNMVQQAENTAQAVPSAVVENVQSESSVGSSNSSKQLSSSEPKTISPQSPSAPVEKSINTPSTEGVEITPEMSKTINGESANKNKTPDNKLAPGNIIYSPVTTAASNTVVQKPEITAVIKPNVIKSLQKTLVATDNHFKKSSSVKTVKEAHIAAWAIQMGNFHIRQNALHLTNVLQAAGYKAFTRNVKSSNGNIATRVYIGPESQQVSAVKLAKHINATLNLQGFVVNYHSLPDYS